MRFYISPLSMFIMQVYDIEYAINIFKINIQALSTQAKCADLNHTGASGIFPFHKQTAFLNKDNERKCFYLGTK